MKLIPEWRHAWRLTSLQLAALVAALNAAATGWVLFDGHINPVLYAAVNMGLGMAVAIARLIPQPKVRDITHKESAHEL
jgi:hypothetical protein